MPGSKKKQKYCVEPGDAHQENIYRNKFSLWASLRLRVSDLGRKLLLVIHNNEFVFTTFLAGPNVKQFETKS